MAGNLSKPDFERLRVVLVKIYRRRFRSHKETRYGNVARTFTDAELTLFLNNIKGDKIKLLFKFMAYLGLRINEACNLNVGNIKTEKRELNNPLPHLRPRVVIKEFVEVK